MINEWFLIINPVSGSGRGKRDWPQVSALLKEAGIGFKYTFTEYRDHATDLARKAVEEGWRGIICVGGDGSANEVINGIFTQNNVSTKDVSIALIPVGVGKDWGRTIGIPSHYTDAVNAIKNASTFIQDAGLVQYYDAGTLKKRYFANVAGIGYDALVTEKANLMKEQGRSGTLPYLLSLITCLLKYRYTSVKLKVDGIELKDDVFSINVGICKYSGGGMMQVPEAIPDDGLLDLTLIKSIGKLEVLKNVKNLYDGSFIQHPRIETFRGREILIESKPKIYLEVDGESLGHTPLRFNIIPKSVKVIVEERRES
ncbi:diacylglycerol kinase family lipid kinase [candidate division WOR-3 bacterium]|nr:diacylglycerol kinase family lipid kinase [candidate division WOR-3 bacterium]